MRCKWISTKTQFGIILEYFRSNAIEFWLRHNMEVPYSNLGQMQMNFGSDTIWNCLRMFSIRCNWNIPRTQSGIVLEQLRWDEIEFQLRRNMDMSSNNFDERQLNFGSVMICHFFSIILIRCNWVLTKTKFGIFLEQVRSNAFDFPLRHSSALSLNNFDQMQMNFD